MSDTTVNVTFHGAFFDERGSAEYLELETDTLTAVADRGFALVMDNLAGSIRHPTPHYQLKINVRDEPPHRKVINDRGIVYGPWLEGTGSRNQTTRFKGYASFRRARTVLEGQVSEIARPHVERFLERINGR